jgi:predicted GNAT family acetyltransferase
LNSGDYTRASSQSLSLFRVCFYEVIHLMPQPTATPTVQSHSSAERFLERMEPLLLAQEVRYGLMLGIATTVKSQPDFYSANAPYFAVAEDGEGVAAAALMTPPHGIIVYSERTDPDPGLHAIAHDLLRQGWKLPTVNGPEPICTRFASIWSDLANVRAEVGMRERVFELREVNHPTYSPGQMRLATLDDLERLAQWQKDFMDEALNGTDPTPLEEARRRLKSRIEQEMTYVWEDGEVVSWTGTARPTTRGITIGPVYTPPHLRGKGYATSCVAAVSQRMLDRGYSFCTLFTDLANPTSNSIYQKIGYRPVCDYTVYRFVE